MKELSVKTKEFISAAASELESYEPGIRVPLLLTIPEAIQLTGILQLATRHPRLPETHDALARKLVDDLTCHFRPEHAAIHKLIREGWKQDNDVEITA